MVGRLSYQLLVATLTEINSVGSWLTVVICPGVSQPCRFSSNHIKQVLFRNSQYPSLKSRSSPSPVIKLEEGGGRVLGDLTTHSDVRNTEGLHTQGTVPIKRLMGRNGLKDLIMCSDITGIVR